MRFLLADSFTSALARMPAQQAKAVKTTVVDLQIDPAGKGLSFHRIDRSKDPNFWSVRVGRDLRLIVHRTEDSLLVAYVDHHDKAYAWAERRRIETHPSTGAIQIVEVRERVEEVATAVPNAPAIAAAGAGDRLLFASLGDGALLSAGVPSDWLDDVRAATENGFFEVAAHLPAEAAEALLQFAASGTLPASPPSVERDPYMHPDAQRRIRLVVDEEETATGARISVGAVGCIPASLTARDRRTAVRGSRPSVRLGWNRKDRRRPASGGRAGAREPAGSGAVDHILRTIGSLARREAQGSRAGYW